MKQKSTSQTFLIMQSRWTAAYFFSASVTMILEASIFTFEKDKKDQTQLNGENWWGSWKTKLHFKNKLTSWTELCVRVLCLGTPVPVSSFLCYKRCNFAVSKALAWGLMPRCNSALYKYCINKIKNINPVLVLFLIDIHPLLLFFNVCILLMETQN